MKRPAALALGLVLLSACSPGDERSGPAGEPTLAPVSVIRDGLLYAAIKARLAGMDIDSTTRISVSVRAGHVVLSGNVKDAATRQRDAASVRAVRGVTSIDNRLAIGHLSPSAAQTVGDAAVVAAVAGSLAAQTGVNVAGVRIGAANGTVTLAGHAPTLALKLTMLAAARKTPGVRNVVDRIAVK